jgi:hypothetical protein
MENFLRADAGLVVSLVVDCGRRKVTQESITTIVLARFAFVFQPPEIEDITIDGLARGEHGDFHEAPRSRRLMPKGDARLMSHHPPMAVMTRRGW